MCDRLRKLLCTDLDLIPANVPLIASGTEMACSQNNCCRAPFLHTHWCIWVRKCYASFCRCVCVWLLYTWWVN